MGHNGKKNAQQDVVNIVITVLKGIIYRDSGRRINKSGQMTFLISFQDHKIDFHSKNK